MMEQPTRCYADILALAYDFEGQMTTTAEEQISVEGRVLDLYNMFEKRASIDPDLPVLERKAHIRFLTRLLERLPTGYECLDASRPWFCYWILNSLWILNAMPEKALLSRIARFLARCQHPDGGFGGGPGQYAHLAPTYAAVNALSIIGTDEAYDIIDRSKLQLFLWTLRDTDGSFALHKGGEQDIRGTYCAVCVAKITNVYTDSLFDKTAEWIISCQTYEGGFGGCPGMEAHGGYAFCGIASLALLGRTQLCDVDALLRWCVNRQMKLEGGFQGRTNKLVDGCYSFWQGGIFPIVSAILTKQGNMEILETELFNQGALQEYILINCQHPDGGLIDKPGKPRDVYHTCYVLSGLSVAQHGAGGNDPVLLGAGADNEVARLHPAFAIAPHHAYNATHYFIRHPVPVG